jgi:hypothetical protein
MQPFFDNSQIESIFNSGKYTTASLLLLKAISSTSTLPIQRQILYHNLGLCYLSLDRIPEAYEIFSTGVPTVYSLLRRGECACILGIREKSCEWGDRAMQYYRRVVDGVEDGMENGDLVMLAAYAGMLKVCELKADREEGERVKEEYRVISDGRVVSEAVLVDRIALFDLIVQ